MKVEGHECIAALNVVGYQRSGQHGVAGWIMANLPSPSVFLNNLGPMGADELWYVNGLRVNTAPSDNATVVVRGLEGCYRRTNGTSLPTVFVIRDIKNHMASLIKRKHRRLSPNWPDFFRAWEEYARILDGDVPREVDYPIIPTSFPHWFDSSWYRRDTFSMLIDSLGIQTTYTDAGTDALMESGGGSSFDLLKYDGRASQMAVLSRWKEVELPPIPQSLLDLDAKLFGEILNDYT